MQRLKEQVERSYADHPCFRFGESWSAPDAASMAAFSAGYRAAREHGVQLGRQDLARRRAECGDALATIFATLRIQAADLEEEAFLDELKAECQRLIGEEFEHFASQRAVELLEGATPLAVEDALQLSAQRHFFGRLARSAVDEMLDRGAATLALLRQRAAAGQVSRNALSINAGPVVRAMVDILNREFQALGVLDAMSVYARRPVRVTGLAVELSVPHAHWWRNGFSGLPRAPDTLYAHLDESCAVPKSIVYLSDVGPANGPTSCYPLAYEDLELHPLQEIIGRVVGNVGGRRESPLHKVYRKAYHQSMTSDGFRHHYMRLPAALRFNSHLGWDILPGSEAEASLSTREKRMTGPAGTFVAFDGARLLHRGGLMESGERIALQVMLSEQGWARRAVKRMRSAMRWI